MLLQRYTISLTDPDAPEILDNRAIVHTLAGVNIKLTPRSFTNTSA